MYLLFIVLVLVVVGLFEFGLVVEVKLFESNEVDIVIYGGMFGGISVVI